jgi:Zn-dependent peptidase ImmA (M78 family)
MTRANQRYVKLFHQRFRDSSNPKIVLCQNHIANQEWMDRTLAHELLHAFDHCRAKVDWSNCEHHACSEVRNLILRRMYSTSNSDW